MPPRQDNAAVALQRTNLARVKEPRVLGTKETRENLDHWLEQFKAYWKRDDRYKVFLSERTVWNFQQDNAGFEAEGDDSQFKRTAEDLKEDLEDFLSALAGHLPFSYITAKLKNSTISWKSCKEAIYEIYGVKTTAGTLLDMGNMKKSPDETHRQFYERMAGYAETHLPFPEQEVYVNGIKIAANGETMTVALHNHLVIDWLKAIDPRLIGLVKTAYSKELKTKNTQLYQLMPDIAENIDELLGRQEAMVQMVSDQMEELQIRRFRDNRDRDGPRSYKGRGRGRGRGDSRDRQNLCPKCVTLQSEMGGTRISANHHPSDCPNKKVFVRMTPAKDHEEYEDEDNYADDFDDDIISEVNDGEKNTDNPTHSHLTFKVTEVKREENLCQHCSQKCSPHSRESFNQESTVVLSEHASHQLQGKLNRVSDVATQAESPAFRASYRGKSFVVVADSGAELNCIDQGLADSLGLSYSKTKSTASAAGQSSISVKGQTTNDFIIQTEFHGDILNLNLQKTVIVSRLGADVLLGEPGLGKNGLKTDATRSLIELNTSDGRYYQKPYMSGKKKTYLVCRIMENQHIYPGESVKWQIPSSLPSDGVYAITPMKHQSQWYDPGIYRASGGIVNILNTSSEVVKIKKHEHVGEVRVCDSVKPAGSKARMDDGDPVIGKVETLPQCQFRYQQFGKKPETVAEPEIELDPDNIMPDEEKLRFRKITNDFADIFTKQPGKYNGYYGRVNNTLNFATKPPPNRRVYQPQYSEEMKRKQAALMDTLYDYGVLRTPEEVGISVEVICPSLLVAKSTPGEYRLVTDLSNINSHIKKCPAVSPIISEAKAMLAKKKFFIHLDLANYFFQSGMNREDCQYLGTVHPFKGTMVYVVEPQGLRNASEHGYEVLARVYGDMCQTGAMTRMADSVFVLGDTYDELARNYSEILSRAQKSGLTFKPGKVVICPQSTVLFGWELNGTEWRPSSHAVSALARAPPPTTVKGMRSFLGSFKQFTECVKGYATVLHDLDLLCAGRGSAEKITWTPELTVMFEKAKAATSRIEGVHLPRPSDVLKTFSDYSEEGKAIGGRLEINRKINGNIVKLHGGYISQILDKLKSKWLPCEGEALGIKLVLEHFAPFLRENEHITVHYTDNSPCVQAWRRSLQGAFSSSARISQFLTGLSALPVELQHKAGIKMNTSDYLSRNPVPCKDPERCQMCKFARKLQAEGENSRSIRSVTVQDVMSGSSLMPYTQRKSWLGAQLMDSVHTHLKKLIQTAQLPDKRKTRGDATKLKQLHTLYSRGDLRVGVDGLVMVKHPQGHFGGWVISIPHQLFPGLANALHITLQHPSRAQLASLMSRYFYTPGHTALVHEVADSCTVCRSLQKLPRPLMENTTERVDCLGSEFAIDIMERNSQKIFLAREKLSQYTWLQLISDQTKETLRAAILKNVLPWVGQSGATIRCDGATALASLAAEAEDKSSILFKNNIKIDVGRLQNKNKNPVAENAIKECAKEIARHKPHVNILSDEDLAVIQKTMNDRIRSRGLAAKEIMLRRDLLSSKPVDIQDTELADKQLADRQAVTNRDKPSNPLQQKPVFSIGDLVYLIEQLSKHQQRQTFIVTALREDQIEIQKLHTQFRQKKYCVFPDEIIHATANKTELFKRNKNKKINIDKNAPSNFDKTTNTPNIPQCETTRPQLRLPRRAKQKAVEEINKIRKVVNTEDAWRLPRSGCVESADDDTEDEPYIAVFVPVITVEPVQDGDEDEDINNDRHEPIEEDTDTDSDERTYHTPESDNSEVQDDDESRARDPVRERPARNQLFPPHQPDVLALRSQLSPVRNLDVSAPRLLREVSLTDCQDLTTVMEQIRPRRNLERIDYDLFSNTGVKVAKKH